MEHVYLTDFFASYSLPTLIIAFVVSIVSLLTDKFLSNKFSNSLRSYLPFVLAIVMYLGYEMIFVCKAFAISANSVYAGMLCGSISLIIKSIISRIKKGKPLSVTQTVLLIEGILSGYVSGENLSATARSVEELLAENAENTDLNNIANTIKENSDKDLSDDEFIRLARLIITAIFSNKQTK